MCERNSVTDFMHTVIGFVAWTCVYTSIYTYNIYIYIPLSVGLSQKQIFSAWRQIHSIAYFIHTVGITVMLKLIYYYNTARNSS